MKAILPEIWTFFTRAVENKAIKVRSFIVWVVLVHLVVYLLVLFDKLNVSQLR